MSHSDDLGLVLPPMLAPLQIVIVPIYKTVEGLQKITEVALSIMKELKEKNITVKFDDDDKFRPGHKFAEYEVKGVPIRLAIGERDLANNTIELARRDNLTKETISINVVVEKIENVLLEMQENLFNNALKRKDSMTTKVDSFDEFKKVLDEKGGFISAHWDGTAETEEKIKEETKATIRCIPLNNKQEEGKCVYSSKISTQRVLFARAH